MEDAILAVSESIDRIFNPSPWMELLSESQVDRGSLKVYLAALPDYFCSYGPTEERPRWVIVWQTTIWNTQPEEPNETICGSRLWPTKADAIRHAAQLLDEWTVCGVEI